MNTWTLGPLVVSGQVLIVAAAVVAAYAVMRLRLRSALPKGTGYERPFEAILIWFLIWKLSVILFQSQNVLNEPRTLLYFSGGVKGAWLATLLAAGYVWYKDRASPIRAVYIDSWLVSIISGYTIYRMLEVAFLEGNITTNAVIAVLGIGTVVLGWMREPQAGRSRMQTLFLSFVIMHALLSAVASNTWDKSGWGSQAASEIGIGIGQIAPDFELTTLEGTKAKLSDYKGKKVLINFWATWCPPCRVEMPVMQQFYSEYKDKNVVILSVDATHTEASQTVVASFQRHWGLTFPLVLDVDGQVGKTYQVSAYPATYVLDEQGVIRKKHQGAMDEDMLKKAVR
ncbi:redoxin domain-containing protein [Paenibacillus sp. UNC451MF]|uniref:redoxin domain-containing protein n=1 Tax=Paenibacillus sp. UNC451MF TaxID=1449063 RepID=UPI000491DAC1|nr:redoxin domain-containing protein [Paenibacillus sp. UNC451MF]